MWKRLALALKFGWRILTQPEFADRAAPLLHAEPEGPDLRILTLLQRDGRLVDFVLEEIDSYSDAQIGAEVRKIHQGCRKVLTDYLEIEPIFTQDESTTVTVPAGFDPNAIRLVGQVSGNPPFKGTLCHKGWRVKTVKFPTSAGLAASANILAPAEVELR
jgi:hypothetical protein